jgi:hypothetical protein
MDTPLYPASQKPGKVQTVAILTLISGISNILWMLIMAAIIMFSGVASFGVGCLFLPVVVPPIVLGVFEIIYAAKLMANPVRPTQPSNVIAIMEIICILTGNIVAVAAGIVALVLYNDDEVKAFFAQLNSALQVVS